LKVLLIRKVEEFFIISRRYFSLNGERHS
jgi:hypothetical protein